MTKKKIKDFTIGELYLLCKNNKTCENCPFENGGACDVYDIIDEDILEREVEVNG
jgi:hypothetical protein